MKLAIGLCTILLNIGVTIPGNWSFKIRRISKSAEFHEYELLRGHQV